MALTRIHPPALPAANTTANGAVTTDTQSIAGAKTFANTVTLEHATLPAFYLKRAGTTEMAMYASGGHIYYETLPSGTLFFRDFGTGNPRFSIANTGQLYERGRSVAIGEWTTYTPTFSTSSAETWTVDGADMQTLAYKLIGKSMTIASETVSTTLSGAVAELRFTIPAGFTIAKSTRVMAQCGDSSGTYAGMMRAPAGQSYIQCYRDVLGNPWAATTNNLRVCGQITFEIT